MKRTLTQFLLVLFAVLTASTLTAADDGITRPMVGHWNGSGRIVVDWCKQPRLPVAIDIHPDGSVTGKVGDATLAHGRLTRNRGWLGRKLNLATDYIIRGDLTDAVVAAEGIHRTSVSMPVNLSSGSLGGGIHTSGAKFGGKVNGILSAGLELTRRQQPYRPNP